MKNRITTYRVVTFLTRQELEFLDKLEKDMIFSTGRHISRSQILQDIVEVFTKTHMDAIGIRNNQELEQSMVKAIAKIKPEELTSLKIKT